jgi:hypothetical protein
MSYAVPSLQPIRDEIASEVAIINDEIDREVVINGGWVDVSGQRTAHTEYVNTTGRTYEVMLRLSKQDYFQIVRLRSPDGAIIDLPLSDITILAFQLKPDESIEIRDDQVSSFIEIQYWIERQL